MGCEFFVIFLVFGDCLVQCILGLFEVGVWMWQWGEEVFFNSECLWGVSVFSQLYIEFICYILGFEFEVVIGYFFGEMNLFIGFGVWIDGDVMCFQIEEFGFYDLEFSGLMDVVVCVWGELSGMLCWVVWNVFVFLVQVEEVFLGEECVYFVIVYIDGDVVFVGDCVGCECVFDQFGDVVCYEFDYDMVCYVFEVEVYCDEWFVIY